MNFNKLKKLENEEVKEESGKGKQSINLGNGSEVIYIQKFIGYEKSWEFFDYLNKHIPWIRPTIRVFGRQCLQPRDTCYVASPGLPELVYSGYKPHAYSWDDFPPIKDLLDMVRMLVSVFDFKVHEALPGSKFNSLLLNRYKAGNDNVGWHADDEKLYGPTPEIASVSFGCEREFLLKKRPVKSSQERLDDEPASKRSKKSSHVDQLAFTLKHGSLLVMRGYTQRDWLHSVPKRAKAEAARINLTFRHVVV
uniref:Fe2OG dioxygenase domain-containing protein n=1 Tax=Salix viminalis TaxID=40686 RepID=A0A6N2JYR5_SALVM